MDALRDALKVAPKDTPPEGYYSVDEMARSMELSRTHMQHRLFSALKDGKVERVKSGNTYYYRAVRTQ